MFVCCVSPPFRFSIFTLYNTHFTTLFCLILANRYGQPGIEKMLAILEAELIQSMQLCGASKLSDLSPALVNTLDLERHTGGFAIPRSPFAPPRFPMPIVLPPAAAATAAGGVQLSCPPFLRTLGELVVAMLKKIVKTTFASSVRNIYFSHQYSYYFTLFCE